MSGLPPLPSNSVLETGLKKVFDEFKVLLTFFPRLIFSPSSCICVASGTGCRGGDYIEGETSRLSSWFRNNREIGDKGR